MRKTKTTGHCQEAIVAKFYMIKTKPRILWVDRNYTASYLICLHFVNHTFCIILGWSWEKLQNTVKKEKKMYRSNNLKIYKVRFSRGASVMDTKCTIQGCIWQSDGLLRLHEKSRWHPLLFPTKRHMKQTFKARAKHLLTSDFSFLQVTIFQGTMWDTSEVGPHSGFKGLYLPTCIAVTVLHCNNYHA